MICPVCGKELDANGVCPECGNNENGMNDAAEAMPAEFEQPMMPEPEAPGVISPEAEISDVKDPGESGGAPQKKTMSNKASLILKICAIVAVLAALAVFIAVRGGDTEPEAADKIFTGTDQQLLDAADKILIESADGAYTVTNAEFNYYYWGEYYYFISSYGYYFDTTLPLDEQMFSDTMTWQEYFVDAAIQTALQTLSVVIEADKAGYVLEGEYLENYEDMIRQLEDYSERYEYGSIDEYLIASYGASSDYNSFMTYLRYTYTSTAYTDELYNSLEFSDTEISDYFDMYESDYTSYGIAKDDTPIADIRHILIMPETGEDGESTDEQWQAAEDEINEIYAMWQEQGGTEEAFASIAELYSEDTQTALDGGSLTGLTPGQTLEAFDSWVFAEGREIGDCEIVETEIGYHIVYYSAEQGIYWQIAAKSDLAYETLMNMLTEISDSYEFKLFTDGIVLSNPTEISAGYIEQITDNG